MKPLVFNDTIGWLRAANGRRGVVVAGSHGFEDLCSRRFLTLVGDHIARSGSPVLQFDYPGCGNAAGDHTPSGRVPAWIESIGAAIDELKRHTGVAEVIVVGFRLGALLAVRAIEGRSDVAGLALLAPPASGRAYARELTALSRMVGATVDPDAEPFEGRIIAGFRLSNETFDNIGSLDWNALPRSPGMPILVMASTLPATLSKWAGAQAAAPNAVAFDEFEGYGRLMCDPTANKIPMSVVERCAAWVREKAAGGQPAQRPCVDAGTFLLGPDYEEEPILIGPKPDICGVLCRPSGGIKPKDAVIFLNAGAVPHVGWARGTVESARMLASAGIASLRIDLPGLGQSDAPAEERLFLYDRRGSADIRRVIDRLEREGFERVGIAGICSGAFQAFHAARADKRVSRLVMVNPLCFSWNSSYALDMSVWKAYETAKAVRKPSETEAPPPRGGRHAAALKALASKGSRRLIRRGLEVIKTTLASPLALVQRGAVERWMRDLSDSGVQVLIATSEGDLSLQEIDRHFGPDGERLRAMPNVGRLSLRDADHTLTPFHARRALVSRLVDHVCDMEPRASQGGASEGVLGPASLVTS